MDHDLNWKQRYAAYEIAELVQERRMARRDALVHLSKIFGGSTAALAFLAACSSDGDTGRTSTTAAPTSTTLTASAPSPTAVTSDVEGHRLSVAADDPDLRVDNVTFVGPSATMQGYLATPNAPGSRPGIVVIHEIFGLNDHIRDVARRLAKVGYVAIAIDLASRAGGTDQAANVIDTLISGPAEDNLDDLDATLEYLSTLPECNGRLGAVGFCFGGGMTLALAGASRSLEAAVSYYGVTPDPVAPLRSTKAAVLAHYGAIDDRVNATIPALEGALAGKTFRKHVWAGVGHQFNNDTSGAYNEAVAIDAWNETLAWFAQYLS